MGARVDEGGIGGGDKGDARGEAEGEPDGDWMGMGGGGGFVWICNLAEADDDKEDFKIGEWDDPNTSAVVGDPVLNDIDPSLDACWVLVLIFWGFFLFEFCCAKMSVLALEETDRCLGPMVMAREANEATRAEAVEGGGIGGGGTGTHGKTDNKDEIKGPIN